MTPSELSAAAVRRLIAEMRADRRALAERDAELDDFLTAWAGSEAGQAAALAVVLDRAYTTLEALLERALRAIDGEPPRSRDWHRALLRTAALEIPKLRPAILAGAEPAADELRRFRHFLRHAYAAPLDAARIMALAKEWTAARPRLTEDLDGFEAFLEELVEHLEQEA